MLRISAAGRDVSTRPPPTGKPRALEIAAWPNLDHRLVRAADLNVLRDWVLRSQGGASTVVECPYARLSAGAHTPVDL